MKNKPIHKGRMVSFSLRRKAKLMALELRAAELLPNMQETIREIVRTDYENLARRRKGGGG